MGWINEDTFEFWIPGQAVICKGSKDGSDQAGRRWIQGIASTSAKDLQGEIVEQNGIDLKYFLHQGYFNNDHKDGFDNKVGEPTEAKITKNGLWVKGFLYKNKKVADDIWEMLQSLESSGAKRRIGFSIQGKVKRREGSTIKECWIQEVAITACPVNTTTWAEIAKSLSQQPWDLSKDSDTDEADQQKALAAGYGSPLVPESLEGSQKKVTKGFTLEETVELLMKSYGYSYETASGAATAIFHVDW